MTLKIKLILKSILIWSFLLLSALPTRVGAVKLVNPLTGKASSITPGELYGRIIKGFLGASGAVALVAFIWGGFLWLTSGGNPEKVKKGKETLVWAIIGLIVIFGSYTILNYIISTITTSTGTAGS